MQAAGRSLCSVLSKRVCSLSHVTVTGRVMTQQDKEATLASLVTPPTSCSDQSFTL